MHKSLNDTKNALRMCTWTKGSHDPTLVKGKKRLKNIQWYYLRERKYFTVHNDVHFLSCGEHINQVAMKISGMTFIYKKNKILMKQLFIWFFLFSLLHAFEMCFKKYQWCVSWIGPELWYALKWFWDSWVLALMVPVCVSILYLSF